MPSVRYYNASAPFWDFVAEMENNANNRNTNNNNEGSDNEENEHPNPWANAWAGAPWGAFPFRGRRHGPHHHHGPPPPPPAPGAEGEADPEEGPSGPPQDEESGPEHHRGPHHRAHAHHHGHGHGPHRRCGPGARGAPWGGRGRGGFWGGGRGRSHFHPYAMGPFGPLAEMFQNQLFGDDTNTAKDNKDETFTPEIDVFDTPSSFVIHISLPGAKKEDVGVNWDADKSELSIGGVVYRPGDEEFLKTLALDERKIGAFERKVRLGSRANPAQVDVEGISARMEDGILTVEVPKVEEGFVEVRKVDIE